MIKRILVIEKLNIGIFLLTLPFSLFFKKTTCIQLSPLLWPKSFQKIIMYFGYYTFEHQEIKDQAYNVVRDAYNIHEKIYKDIRKEGLLLRLLGKVDNNPKLELAIKKQLILNVENSVFNIYCLNQIKGSCYPDSKISFLPYNLFYHKEFRGKLDVGNVPFLWSIFLYISEYSSRIFKPLLFSFLFLAEILISRGISIRKLPMVRKDIGYSINGQFNDESLKRQYNNTFIYDDKEFQPSKILHIFDFHKASENSREFLKKRDAVIGDYYTEKMLLSYFIRTFLGRYIIYYFLYSPFLLFHTKRYSIYILSTLQTIRNYILMDIFYNRHYVKVYINRDEYNPFHVVRTVILNRRGGKTIGFMHGAFSSVYYNRYAYTYLDRYCIWGYINKMFIGHYFKDVKSVKIIGPYRNDFTYRYYNYKSKIEDLEYLKKEYKVVTVFDDTSEAEPHAFNKILFKRILGEFLCNHSDSPGSRIAIITPHALMEFINIIKYLADMHKSVFFLLKTKYSYILDMYRENLADYKSRILVLPPGFSTYDLIGFSDLIVTLSSSIFVESLCSGKKTIMVEPYNDKNYMFPQMKYLETLTDMIFCHNKNEIIKNFERVIYGTYLDRTTEEKLINLLGHKFDGKGMERLKKAITSLMY